MAKSKKNRAHARARARTAAREAKAMARLRDVGPDHGGNYGVNPYAARGHRIEVAPKDLGHELPKDSQFPKRIATQRMIDRYLAHGHIGEQEHRAAEALWRAWVESGLEARVCAGYDPDAVSGGGSTDGVVAARIDGAIALVELLGHVPARCRGVVRAVVIEDVAASDWARKCGYGDRASKEHGLARLSQGLSALAQHMGC